jgi:hypothetical protein
VGHLGARNAPRLWALVAAATALAFLTACGPGEEARHPARDNEVEQRLASSLTGSHGIRSHGIRYTHVRCVKASAGDWTHLCTFQVVSPGLAGDQPLLVLGYRVEGGQLRSGSGTVPLDVACAEELRCWTSTLCAATRDCPSGFERYFGEPVTPPARAVTPRPTVSRCIASWNAHGGFSPAETAQATPPIASMEVARPVYTPHLSGASLGFIGPRAEVRAGGDACSVLFDTGASGLYRVSAQAWGQSRFWMWRGADDFEAESALEPAWNVCQRDDGTLFPSDTCPPVAAIPRAIADELERGHLASLYEMGGIPYWLGRSFEGARPEALESRRGAESVVVYRVRGEKDSLTLTVYTYRPPQRSREVRKGVVVARAEPEDATVLVVADRKVSDALRHSVLGSLRPFISTNPDAAQVPGDLQEEPTRIDTSVPVRLLWVGPSFEGFTGSVVQDGPEGAGVVRYAKGGSEWFLVTYTARKKKHCGQIGCVSPPPLPAALRRYGSVVHTILSQDDLTVVLARRPRIVPDSALLFDGLRPVG